MSKTIDFTKLPIGTEVWYLGQERGVITELGADSAYPVGVLFARQLDFTKDGRESAHLDTPVLFLRPFDLVIPDEAYELPAPPDPPIGTLCWFWENEKPDYKYIGYFGGRSMSKERVWKLPFPNAPEVYAFAYDNYTTQNPYAEAGE